MQNWKATIRTWERNNYNKPKSKYDVLDNLDLDSNPFAEDVLGWKDE